MNVHGTWFNMCSNALSKKGYSIRAMTSSIADQNLYRQKNQNLPHFFFFFRFFFCLSYKVNKPFYKILLKFTSKIDNKLPPNTKCTTTNKQTITAENGF